jgi:hypothetical protein
MGISREKSERVAHSASFTSGFAGAGNLKGIAMVRKITIGGNAYLLRP